MSSLKATKKVRAERTILPVVTSKSPAKSADKRNRNPRHREDFERLLSKAVGSIQP